MSDAVYTQSTKYSGTYLVTIFFRSTVCTSCHFRTGMDHLDKPFFLPVFSECVMRCHLCLFRSPVPPALFLPSARSGYGIKYGSSSLRWNWSSRRTYRIPSSYILPVDLSVRMPADRFPDGADPYHRCDPSSVYRLPLTVPLAPSHAAALLPGILLLSPRMLLQHALSMYA